jgi:hypothetical protein
MKRLVLAAVFSLPFAALAGDEHCHQRAADGKLTDLPAFTSKKSCLDNQGVWLGHGPHCDVKLGDGAGETSTENGRLNTESKCKARGGKWGEHGHGPHKG